MRLRPTGKSGSLVMPLERVRALLRRGAAQLWERQALTRARVVFGDAGIRPSEVMAAVDRDIYNVPWRPELAEEIQDDARPRRGVAAASAT